MSSQQTSPMVKFEKFEQSLDDSFDSFDSLDNSPAESLMSYHGSGFPSLFGDMTPPCSDSTMNPMEMMTPESFTDEQQHSNLATIPEEKASSSPSPSPGPNSDKKTTKKRKSWGQVLPEPKTNLPPR